MHMGLEEVQRVAAQKGCRCCTGRYHQREDFPCPVCQDRALREALCPCFRRGLRANRWHRPCCTCWNLGYRLGKREAPIHLRVGP